MKKPDCKRINGKNSLMTIREAAAYLHVSRSAIYRLVQAKVFPAARLGPRLTRIPKLALDRYLEGSF